MDFKPEIEILVATMNRDSLNFLQEMFPNGIPGKVGVLIVNQSQTKVLNTDKAQVSVINSKTTGLSKSRNLALKHAKADICVFTDDDVVFSEDFEGKIKRAFIQFPESAFIRFSTKTKDKSNLSWLDIMNTQSIEMSIRRKIIREHDILFNEYFGLGSHYFEMGEEQVFLSAIKKQHLQLSNYYGVLNTHESLSSARKKNVEERYYIHGAQTTAIFGRKALNWVILKIIYALKQKKIKFNEIITAFKSSKKGRKAYLKLKHEQDS